MRVFPLIAVLLLAESLGAAPARAPSPNFMLIVLDTVRYDAVSAANTPFLDSLRSRSVVFTQAYSTHDFTPESHFSMVTGLRDGLGTADDRAENGVPFQLRTLLGYDTFALAVNSLIRPKLMPSFRGFSRWDDLTSTVGSDLDELQARGKIDARLALFRVRQNAHTESVVYFSAARVLPEFVDQIRAAHAPWFGFVNLMDAHEPYVPDPTDYPPEKNLPPGFTGDPLHRVLGPELRDPDQIPDPARRAYVQKKIDEAGSPFTVSIDLPPQALAIYRSRYMAEVRETDAVLRQFFAVLQHEKLLDTTYVIITSDHGESFGEADLLTHNFHDAGDFESTHHVPFMIVLPPNAHAAATVIDRRVSIGSIAPTLYDLARLDWSALPKRYSAYARSLAPLFVQGKTPAVATVKLPPKSASPDTEAARAREQMMRSLGYIQ